MLSDRPARVVVAGLGRRIAVGVPAPFTPSGEMTARLSMSWHDRGMHRLELEAVPKYPVVLLEG